MEPGKEKKILSIHCCSSFTGSRTATHTGYFRRVPWHDRHRNTLSQQQVLGTAPMIMPWVLYPSCLFWDAESHHAHNIKWSTGILCVFIRCSFMARAWSSKPFACLIVSVVLWFTWDKSRLTSADRCGATCCACQRSPPNNVLNWDFSQSSVGDSVSCRLIARRFMYLSSSTYWAWDNE